MTTLRGHSVSPMFLKTNCLQNLYPSSMLDGESSIRGFTSASSLKGITFLGRGLYASAGDDDLTFVAEDFL